MVLQQDHLAQRCLEPLSCARMPSLVTAQHCISPDSFWLVLPACLHLDLCQICYETYDAFITGLVSHHQPRTYHLPYSRVPTRPGSVCLSLEITDAQGIVTGTSRSDMEKLGRGILSPSSGHSHFPNRLIFLKNGGDHLKVKKP